MENYFLIPAEYFSQFLCWIESRRLPDISHGWLTVHMTLRQLQQSNRDRLKPSFDQDRQDMETSITYTDLIFHSSLPIRIQITIDQ
jgi:hypothetical protein